MTANVIGFTISGGERPGAPGSWAVDGHLGGAGGLGLGASGLQDPIIPDPETPIPKHPPVYIW